MSTMPPPRPRWKRWGVIGGVVLATGTLLACHEPTRRFFDGASRMGRSLWTVGHFYCSADSVTGD